MLRVGPSRPTARRPSRVAGRCGVLGTLLGLTLVVPPAANAASSPSPTSSANASLSHSVTTFGILFLVLAVLAAVMFAIVVVRLRAQ